MSGTRMRLLRGRETDVAANETRDAECAVGGFKCMNFQR